LSSAESVLREALSVVAPMPSVFVAVSVVLQPLAGGPSWSCAAVGIAADAAGGMGSVEDPGRSVVPVARRPL